MSSPTHRSESNLRRYGKPARKKSTPLYSDYYDERDDSDSHHLVSTQRSVSLTALHPGQMAPVTLEPRMAQLETLEAKMASIEVSLSTTPRRKKNGNGVQTLHRTHNGTAVPNSVPASIPAPVIPIQSQESSHKDVLTRELESLRNALKDKENVIQSLKGQLCISRLSATYLTGGTVGGTTSRNTQSLSDKERRAAEERLQRLRHEMDNKRVAIKNLKMALERLDITDNIDVRIQQAELEYQLGREELNLLTLLEESRGLQLCLELRATSIFSCVSGSGHVTLHAVELNYDPKSPRFGAGPREDSPGLYVEWAAEDSAMIKGDRLLEVNGKVVLTLKGGKEDLARLLAASPDPAQIVVLRKSSNEQELRARTTEAERLKETFRAENLRLTHRISYLEEQVAELQQKAVEEKDGEIGVRPESQSSPAPSPATSRSSGLQVFQKGPQVTALVAGAGISSPVESRHSLPTVRSSSKSHDIRSAKSLDLNSDSSHHHHHHHHHHHRHHVHRQHQLQSAKSITSLQHPDKQHDARSVRSLDLDTDLQQTRTQQRPTPPKKPLRLSLQRATSLQSVSPCPSPSPGSGSHKPTKRNHKGEAPQPPPPARSLQAALRWHSPAAALHHLKAAQHRLTVSEKWC